MASAPHPCRGTRPLKVKYHGQHCGQLMFSAKKSDAQSSCSPVGQRPSIGSQPLSHRMPHPLSLPRQTLSVLHPPLVFGDQPPPPVGRRLGRRLRKTCICPPLQAHPARNKKPNTEAVRGGHLLRDAGVCVHAVGGVTHKRDGICQRKDPIRCWTSVSSYKGLPGPQQLKTGKTTPKPSRSRTQVTVDLTQEEKPVVL